MGFGQKVQTNTALSLPALASALLLACTLPAQADWRQLAPQRQEAFAPNSYLSGSNGSLWSLSDDGVRLTRADGTTRMVAQSSHLPFSEAHLLADGGVLLRAGCELQRVDAQGLRGWRQPPASPGRKCRDLAVASTGESWFNTGSQLLAYDARGRQQTAITLSDIFQVFDSVDTLANGDAVAAIDSSQTRDMKPAELMRYDRQGAPVWSWSIAAPARLERVRITSDGDILAVVRNTATRVPDYALQRWNSSGQLLWRLPLSPRDPYKTLQILPAADGEAYVLTGSTEFTSTLEQVMRVTRDGSIRWQESVGCRNFTSSQIVLDAGDDLTLLCLGEADSKVLRWNAAGEHAPAQTLPLAYSNLPLAYSTQSPGASLSRLDADTLLAVGDSSKGALYVRTPRQSLRIGRDGSVTPHPLNSRLQPAPTEGISHYFAADGSSYVATQRHTAYDSRDGYDLSKYAADGRRLWTQARAPARSLYESTLIAAAGGRVCIAEARSALEFDSTPQLACFNDSDGSLLWQAPLTQAKDIYALQVLADGRVVAVVYHGNVRDGMAIQSYHADGRQIGSITTGYVDKALIDANGRTTVASSIFAAQYEFDGRQNYRVTLATGEYAPIHAIAMAGDGSAWLLHGPSAQPGRIRALRPDGTTRWLATSDDALDSHGGNELIVADEAVYMLQQPWDSYGPLDSRLLRFDATTGVRSWKYESHNPGLTGADGLSFAVSADGSRVLLVHAWSDRLRLERLRSSDGALEQERFIAAQNSRSSRRGQVALALDGAGTARVALNLLDENAGHAAGLIAIDHAGVAAPPMRVDQPGIAGAWWSPYANGEGIALDWIVPQRTLFGAWFTYTSAGGNDPAQLRWYTIQAGNVAANATSVQLPILETTGGNFDAGPPASPIPVGTARLYFTDCDNGTLEYRFDAGHNDGASGTITLSRLTPATGSCILADGSTRPGTGAKPPQGGFDARMSGTWFEEATSGQGLQFTVQPGGTFFAPWFTYDPQGQGNDANREHWFTLQGNLATAVDGKADVLIAQSLGGVFDRVPTYNGFAVGKATIQMTACDKARVDYLFDDTDLAGSFRKRSGTLELSKIGGCMP